MNNRNIFEKAKLDSSEQFEGPYSFSPFVFRYAENMQITTGTKFGMLAVLYYVILAVAVLLFLQYRKAQFMMEVVISNLFNFLLSFHLNPRYAIPNPLKFYLFM